MRRIGTALGALMLAALMGGSLTGSSWAANGTLRVGFDTYQNPSGCYESNQLPMTVGNQTDKTAVVYNGKGCRGFVVGQVPPGSNGTFEFGQSVYVA